MGFFRAIIGFIFAIAMAAFAVSNRQSVEFVYSPVHTALELPLYLIALLFMVVGFIFGGIVVWFNAGTVRRTKRAQRKTIKQLEKEIKVLESKTADFPVQPKNRGITDLLPKRSQPKDDELDINTAA